MLQKIQFCFISFLVYSLLSFFHTFPSFFFISLSFFLPLPINPHPPHFFPIFFFSPSLSMRGIPLFILARDLRSSVSYFEFQELRTGHQGYVSRVTKVVRDLYRTCVGGGREEGRRDKKKEKSKIRENRRDILVYSEYGLAKRRLYGVLPIFCRLPLLSSLSTDFLPLVFAALFFSDPFVSRTKLLHNEIQ